MKLLLVPNIVTLYHKYLKYLDKYFISDYDSCIVVCRDWRAFIGRNLICGEDKKTRDMVYAKKMTYEWLHGKPKVSKMKIANNLAPPLKMYADRSDIILTTIDSILVWNRRTGTNCIK